ncbi:hypothetical protein TNCV_1099711 [Trichonephila clavipes]|nr:hypothetical protein TNCV_1099711 [Trichonephila clavipes]
MRRRAQSYRTDPPGEAADQSPLARLMRQQQNNSSLLKPVSSCKCGMGPRVATWKTLSDVVFDTAAMTSRLVKVFSRPGVSILVMGAFLLLRSVNQLFEQGF